MTTDDERRSQLLLPLVTEDLSRMEHGLAGPSTRCERGLQCLQDLGDLGVVVSITYGPMKNGQIYYSVNATSPSGKTFDLPYMAESFYQAIWIAASESLKRNWI